jgi:antitoxin component YwqK of YwqJK toxin-antitoxin module
LENGIFREWDEQGEILRAARYKNGQLIENLLN